MPAPQRTYPHGVPCWIDTSQPDPTAARHFYWQLFGWEYADTPAPYWLASLDGADEGGMEQADGSAQWNTYIRVDDVDQACKNIEADGGKILMSATKIPAGTNAICEDPQGAQFRLWDPDKRIGVQAVNIPGAWNFSVLRTSNVGSAFDFYKSFAGWQSIGDDPALGIMVSVPGYGDHLANTVDPDIYERQAFAPEGFADVVAGIESAGSDEPANWRVKFSVADCDSSAALAEQLGATVIGANETQWTREALIRDPQGAEFGISQFLAPS